MASLVESSIFSLEELGFSVLYWYIDRGEVEVILRGSNGDFTEAVRRLRERLKAKKVNLEILREEGGLLIKVNFKLGRPPRGLKPRGLNDILAWGPMP
ncbi:MAG: hypothetical protein J7L91_00555 [Candidatus Korarchaeota archaeon]|nr:hypothetical protein [Candidatus Korarchaeota archaeon]